MNQSNLFLLNVICTACVPSLPSPPSLQLLSYSQFLGDTTSGPRLIKAMAGLAAYTLLHSTSAVTGPLHELLLARNPLLLYRWHRYMDAWQYGSGQDYKPAAAVAPPPPAAAAAVVGGGGGRDSTAAIGNDAHRSSSSGDHGDPADGNSRAVVNGRKEERAVGSSSTKESISSTASAPADLEQQPNRHTAEPTATATMSYCRPFGPVIATASFTTGSHSSSSSSSGGSEGQEGQEAWAMTHSVDTHEEAMFGYEDGMLVGLELTAEGLAALDPSRYSVDTYEEGLEGELRFKVSGTAGAAATVAVADLTHSVDTYEDSLLVGYELGAEGLAALDPSRLSVDTYEEGLEGEVTYSSSKSKAAAAAGAGTGGYASHSIDTYEDSLLVGTNAAAAALASDDPSRYSVDTYEEGLNTQLTFKTAAAPTVGTVAAGGAGAAKQAAATSAVAAAATSAVAAAATAATTGATITTAATGAAATAAPAAATAEGVSIGDAIHSVDTYEDSLLVGWDLAGGLSVDDPGRYSVDTYEEGLEPGFGGFRPVVVAAAAAAAAGESEEWGGAGESCDTYEDALLVGCELGAEGLTGDDLSRYSVDTYEEGLEPQLPFKGLPAQPPPPAAAGAVASHSIDTFEDALLVGCEPGAEGLTREDPSRYSVDTYEEGPDADLRFRMTAADKGSDASHSVDTHEDSVLLEAEIQAAAAAARAVDDPSRYSVDTYDIASEDPGVSGKGRVQNPQPPPPPPGATASAAAASAAAAAAATSIAAAAGGDVLCPPPPPPLPPAAATNAAAGSVPIIAAAAAEEDVLSSGESLEESLNYEWGLQAAINAIRDATKSVDTYEDALDEDWDLEPSFTAPPAAAPVAAGAAVVEGPMHSVDTYDDALDDDWSAGAAVAKWDVTHSVDTYDECFEDPSWGGESSPASSASSSAAAVTAEATADKSSLARNSVDTYEEALGVYDAAAGGDMGRYSVDTYEEVIADAINSFSALREATAAAATSADYGPGGSKGVVFEGVEADNQRLRRRQWQAPGHTTPAVADDDDEATAAADDGDDDDNSDDSRRRSDEQQLSDLMIAREVVAWSSEGGEADTTKEGASGSGKGEGEGVVRVEEEGAATPSVRDAVAAAAEVAGKGGKEGQEKPKAGAWRGAWRPKVDPAAMKDLMDDEGGEPDE